LLREAKITPLQIVPSSGRIVVSGQPAPNQQDVLQEIEQIMAQAAQPK
jgi:hypothetical protein